MLTRDQALYDFDIETNEVLPEINGRVTDVYLKYKLLQVGSGITSVLGGVCLFVLVHWVGKRKLSLVAMAGSAASCLVIALYSYIVMSSQVHIFSPMPWIPLTMVIALSFFNSLFFYVPWNLLCEVFPFR